MKFTNTEVWGFKHAFRGMRNPKNSWELSDSNFSDIHCNNDECLVNCEKCGYYNGDFNPCIPKIGERDMALAKSLISGGSEHRKFMRQIFVSVDITAPLFWFKEFDTYKIGTAANSTSTMHKLTSKPITLDCFETDDYTPSESEKIVEHTLIPFLEELRNRYIKTRSKSIWKELVRWLPESWLQTRTITMSYENVYTIVHQRMNHKLNEWSGKDDPSKPNFIAWARSLPYADELIFGEETKQRSYPGISNDDIQDNSCGGDDVCK